MNSDLEELVSVSRRYGADPSFVLAGGGNTSLKERDSLWVKASGFALDGITSEGFVQMRREALDELLERGLPDDPVEREKQFVAAVMAARTHADDNRRPSVECVLHHILEPRLVVHSHSTQVNMLTCSEGGVQLARQVLGPEVLWLPYVDPGYTLACALRDALAQWPGQQQPRIILMQNHGLIVSGDTLEEIETSTAAVIEAIKIHLSTQPKPLAAPAARLEDEQRVALVNVLAPALRGLLAESDLLKLVSVEDCPQVQEFLALPEARAVALGGPLTPDQIVYCRSFPLWFEPRAQENDGETVERLRQELAGHVRERRFVPNVVLVPGVGLFAAGATPPAARTAAAVYVDAIKVILGALRCNGVHPLNERQYRFIEDWEVEAYRRGVSLSGGGAGRVAGKVAVVTGAAQGFGLEIARGLAAHGAYVVLCDMNAAGAAAATDELNCSHKGCALGLEVDVTNGESVQAMLHRVVRHFGGFDIFISNAGVLRAESVKTQSEKDFDFVTRVNYKGYFVCVQHAASILALQHRARSQYQSDIIQINSKSGLEGSNRNGAYAGSKFGGIGLTQSFAMELVEDGVKVNAICPGNFFDGPLWSDPENGLFMQYLRTDKVPGAKTVADVRKAYEAKVPMGRGCEAADVIKAILYLVEQQYETGQALPVTGGQVMLH